MKSKRPRKAIKLSHALAALAGVLCFALVYLYTGDADLLFAVSGGLLAGAASLMITYISVALRNSTG